MGNGGENQIKIAAISIIPGAEEARSKVSFVLTELRSSVSNCSLPTPCYAIDPIYLPGPHDT